MYPSKQISKFIIYLFQQYEVVPATPLVTSVVLREETDQWQEVQQGMSLALQEMRVEEQGITLKKPETSKSALMRKRMKKDKAGLAPAPITEETSVDVSESATKL